VFFLFMFTHFGGGSESLGRGVLCFFAFSLWVVRVFFFLHV